MKIGIDASWAVNEKAGVGRYTKNLINQLLKADQRDNYILFFNFLRNYQQKKESVEEFNFRNATSRLCPLPGKLKELIWQNRFFSPLALFLGPLDLFHAPVFLSVPRRKNKTKIVLTIHDLAFMRFPEIVGNFFPYFKQRTAEAISNSDLIIAVSKATKSDLIQFFPPAAEKIRVIYSGAEEKFQKVSEPEEHKLKTKYKLSGDFILFVGTLEPRKNLVKLIRAYSLLEGELKRKYALVIAGKKGWAFSPIFKEVEKLKLKDRVRFLDYVSEEDLPALYSAATLFAFPSLYEGFGLPVLEAMRCGTPVLSSNTSSIPELAEDAALLINPLDEQEIAQGITRILKNERMRKEMSRKGARRAGGFSWLKTAEETLKAYHACLTKDRRS